MTLKEYIEGLQKFAEENPETLEMEIITSKDDEGNGYNPVYYGPTKGFFNEEDFISEDQYEDWGLDKNATNVVCVN